MTCTRKAFCLDCVWFKLFVFISSARLVLAFTLSQAIGVTIGLFSSSLIVYSFGSKKKAGMFAF